MSRRRSRAATVAAVLLVTGLAAAPACPHDQPYSWLDLRLAPDGVAVRITAHVVDLAHEAGIATPDSLLAPAFLDRHAAALERMLASRLALVADGDTLRPRWTGAVPIHDRRAVAFDWNAAWAREPGLLRVEGALFPYDPQHETYLNVYESRVLRHQDQLDHERTRYDHYTGTHQGSLAVLRVFLLSGTHHIFIGPDHILFIVGLLLLGGSAMRLLKIVTAFTLAHSVTLALATLDLVTPPPRLIEPAIALSIVAVGVSNLRARPGGADGRAWAALGFGFIHGFGFANVLRDFGLPREALGISLFAFNAGVEVGQACIVALVAPPLALLRRRSPALARRVVLAGSVIVALAGAWWFVERAFLAR
jgi:hydrogenase/urease accessory protein HupE